MLALGAATATATSASQLFLRILSPLKSPNFSAVPQAYTVLEEHFSLNLPIKISQLLQFPLMTPLLGQAFSGSPLQLHRPRRAWNCLILKNEFFTCPYSSTNMPLSRGLTHLEHLRFFLLGSKVSDEK